MSIQELSQWRELEMMIHKLFVWIFRTLRIKSDADADRFVEICWNSIWGLVMALILGLGARYQYHLSLPLTFSISGLGYAGDNKFAFDIFCNLQNIFMKNGS